MTDAELAAVRRDLATLRPNLAMLCRGVALLVWGLWLYALTWLRLAWLYMRRALVVALPWASWVFVAIGACNAVLAIVAAFATGHYVIAELWGVVFVVEAMCLILIRPSGGFRR